MRVKGSGESTGGGACPSVNDSLRPSPPVSALASLAHVQRADHTCPAPFAGALGAAQRAPHVVEELLHCIARCHTCRSPRMTRAELVHVLPFVRYRRPPPPICTRFGHPRSDVAEKLEQLGPERIIELEEVARLGGALHHVVVCQLEIRVIVRQLLSTASRGSISRAVAATSDDRCGVALAVM